MAAPLGLEILSRVSTFGRLFTPLASLQTRVKVNSLTFNSLPARLFSNGVGYVGSLSVLHPHLKQSHLKPTLLIIPTSLAGGLKPDHPYLLVPSRNYGRKGRQNPARVFNFDYSGDLRKIPEMDSSVILYRYKELEDQLEGNENLRQLATLKYATSAELSQHRQNLVIDRMLELFGPDCELEQNIALMTLNIRMRLPKCLHPDAKKSMKISLEKTINVRKELLTKLRSLDHERFEWLLRELKIRYFIPKESEEFKGRKHKLRIDTQEEAREKQRQKLKQLKAKFEAEKKIFFEHKANTIAKIDEDLDKFGLDREFLNNLIKADIEAEKKQKRAQREAALRQKAEAKNAKQAS